MIQIGTKLNLGCRNRALEGYQNMDCEKHDGVDFVGDVSDLRLFDSDSVETIRASHILEHFPHVRTLDVLREWHRVLIPGGMLEVAVPDFKRTVELYQKYGLCNWVQNFIMGDQGYKTAFHYAIFDEQRLHDLLLKAGFSEASRVIRFQVSDPYECSNNVDTNERRPVSLNMVAIK